MGADGSECGDRLSPLRRWDAAIRPPRCRKTASTKAARSREGIMGIMRLLIWLHRNRQCRHSSTTKSVEHFDHGTMLHLPIGIDEHRKLG